MATNKRDDELMEYTAADVAEHKEPEDAWVIIEVVQ
jgi:hypothetical protein